MAIAATGAGILNIIEHTGSEHMGEPLTDGVRWLLVGAVTTALVSIGALMHNVEVPEAYLQHYQRGRYLVFGVAVVMALSGLLPFAFPFLLAWMVMLLLILVVYGVTVWLKVTALEQTLAADV
jgi:hypothetical protein